MAMPSKGKAHYGGLKWRMNRSRDIKGQLGIGSLMFPGESVH